MTNLKLKSDEVGYIKYCLIAATQSQEEFLTKKEEKYLWKLVKKIQKQERKQNVEKMYKYPEL